jgi:ABC-2 type transport system ATP-binding protein
MKIMGKRDRGHTLTFAQCERNKGGTPRPLLTLADADFSLNLFPSPRPANLPFMIQVRNFSKSYAGFRAVQGLSFEVARGEIVGFLGPNGAGKTTTMRVLAGYLPPTDGEVRVAGFNVLTESLEVRKRIGYMPESVPLYTEMRVDEFLRFRAKLKRVPRREVGDRVEEAKKLCSLKDVERKIIGTLSKGYRQRVGLADALVHGPELLILDEPTIGLDPKQIISVRELIKELGKKHTILLSTHILSEVEMTCNRVLIIHRGKIEVSDTPENLTRLVRGGGSLRLQVKAEAKEAVAKLEALESVDDVEVMEAGEWALLRIFTKPGTDARDEVYEVIRTEGWALREMTPVRATLEEAFVEITQD